MLSSLRHIQNRRMALQKSIDIDREFKMWEETCVPSYCHRNFAAAYVSWMRLFAAARLAEECVPVVRRVLDFGASVGELSHILKSSVQYNFVEQDDVAASFLMKQNPSAQRQTLQEARSEAYDVVFAIDSLEHNLNFPELLGSLAGLVGQQGVLILSGPTENRLYKLGRRIAGFEGDYHFTSIYEIEAAAANYLERIKTKTIPMGVPLFRISAWKHRGAAVEVQG